MTVETFSAYEIAKRLTGRIDWLLFSVSYEERSPVIWSNLVGRDIRFLAFYNENHDYINTEVEKVKYSLPDALYVTLNSDHPVDSIDHMRKAITQHLVDENPVRIGVDITCFTREALAMLLLVLKHDLPAGSSVICLYTGANDYPSISKEGHEGWLSHGIAEIRSVLGYRGKVRLMAKTHLIMLPGLETERAHSIIEALQPDRLTIGKLAPDECIQPHFSPKLHVMVEQLANYHPSRYLGFLNFSAKNPYFTRNQILQAIGTNENTVISCLNNKIAMVGVCMAIFTKPSTQLYYAQPLQYNLHDTTKSGGEIIQFEL